LRVVEKGLYSESVVEKVGKKTAEISLNLLKFDEIR
jgi:hypothetical protein